MRSSVDVTKGLLLPSSKFLPLAKVVPLTKIVPTSSLPARPKVLGHPLAKAARMSAAMATLVAQGPDARHDHDKQAAAARACAHYAEVAATATERARYLEYAAHYAALALHLRRVSLGNRAGRHCLTSGPSSPYTRRWLTAGPDLSAPSRQPRQRPPGPACPTVRAHTLLAAPGAPNGPHTGCCRVSLDRPSATPAVHTH
ncbi:hypothetical protein [Janibacter melonis]|uniref:hypothetical protein n=1 Tax=Janibacter melonis TaxID=262209 RepID=UPI0018DB4DD8|nr:hypothetical protein [Janibacter melonis]